MNDPRFANRMAAVDIVWDPHSNGTPRYHHPRTQLNCVRHRWMNDLDWDSALENFVSEIERQTTTQTLLYDPVVRQIRTIDGNETVASVYGSDDAKANARGYKLIIGYHHFQALRDALLMVEADIHHAKAQGWSAAAMDSDTITRVRKVLQDLRNDPIANSTPEMPDAD